MLGLPSPSPPERSKRTLGGAAIMGIGGDGGGESRRWWRTGDTEGDGVHGALMIDDPHTISLTL